MDARTFRFLTVVFIGIAVLLWWSGRQPAPMDRWPEQGRAVLSEFRSRPAQDRLSDPLDEFKASLADPVTGDGKVRRSVYVPAYSAVRVGNGRVLINLATTLSIHNTSRDRRLLLQRVDYHKTEGELVKAHLDTPVPLRPLATIQMFVANEDLRGGTGANFVVDWTADGPISEPAIETVMVGDHGTISYSFVSPGRTSRIVGPE